MKADEKKKLQQEAHNRARRWTEKRLKAEIRHPAVTEVLRWVTVIAPLIALSVELIKFCIRR